MLGAVVAAAAFAAAEYTPSVYADFGKRAATGLCIFKGLPPIVSFPKWGSDIAPDQPDFPLGVVNPDGTVSEFKGLNSYFQTPKGKRDAHPQIVSVQSLSCHRVGERINVMYILDSGRGISGDNKEFRGKEAAKLVRVYVDTDGRSGYVDVQYQIPDALVDNGYLNDVRADGDIAYITDSNKGVMYLVDLKTANVLEWRDERMNAHLKSGEKFEIAGRDLGADFSIPLDGIAYSTADDYLYWKPVTRSTLYRVKAKVLRDIIDLDLEDPDFENATAAVEEAGTVGFHDGLDADGAGNVYLTDLVNGAIQKRAKDGTVTHITEPGGMNWPDAVIVGHDGDIWTLTTQVHLMPFLNGGKDLRTEGNKLYRLRPRRSDRDEL